MVQGIAALNKKLTVTIPKRIEASVRAAMEQGAQEVVDMMKRLVPVSVDGSHGKAAGTLRDSIGWTWGDAPAGSVTLLKSTGGREYAGMRITIYAGSKEAFYAKWVEFGTQHAAARRFFYPSWRTMRKRVKSRIQRASRKAIKAEGGR